MAPRERPVMIFAAALLAGLLSASAPAPHVTQATLANGLRIVVVPNHLAPVATTSLLYEVGSNDDTIPGIAHATEHMMFRGTPEITSDQFASIATRIGAEYDAETTNTYTRYYFTVPASYIDVVLRLEADRMQHASMTAASWNTERGAIEQEVKAHLASPLAKVMTQTNQAYYGANSPWARETVGTIAGFQKMQASDIAAFYRTWYHPNNAILVVAGDVDPHAVVASARRFFGSIPEVAVPAHPPLPTAPLAKTALAEQVDFPVPIAARLFRLPGTDSPDYGATDVLFGAFGSKRSAFSDLMLSGKDLLALTFASSIPQGGSGVVFVAARPGTKPQTSLHDISGVIAGYAKNGIPLADIEAAKARDLASQAYEGASIPGEAALWSFAQGVDHMTPAQIYGQIENVTPADVERVFKTYVDTDRAITLALTPQPNASLPTTTGAVAKENVQVKSTASVALPAWTNAYFRAPLKAPQADGDIKLYRLHNGIKLIVRRETSSPTVVISGEVQQNPDLYEPRGKEGVATMTSALLALGTKKYDVKAYQTALDAIAATVSLGSSFSAVSRAADLDATVGLLAEGMRDPAFSPAQFAHMSANSISSLRAFENRPEYRAEIAKTDAMYPPGDPHRRHETAASLSRITLADVRAWYRFAYRPDMTAIAVVGDVDPAQVRAVFERDFGSWTAHGKRPSLEYPPVKGRTGGKSTTIASSTATQSEVTLSQHIDLRRGDRDVVALQLANTMLSGEGTGSMLFQDVREKHGYVYTVDSSLDVGSNGSTFNLTFASDPKNEQPAQRAATATVEQLRRFPPNASQLALAKAMTLSQYFVSLDSYDSVAHDLLDTAESGLDANDVTRYYTRVLAVTPADVQRAMQRWIDPQKFARVVVEPKAAVR